MGSLPGSWQTLIWKGLGDADSNGDASGRGLTEVPVPAGTTRDLTQETTLYEAWFPPL